MTLGQTTEHVRYTDADVIKYNKYFRLLLVTFFNTTVFLLKFSITWYRLASLFLLAFVDPGLSTETTFFFFFLTVFRGQAARA